MKIEERKKKEKLRKIKNCKGRRSAKIKRRRTKKMAIGKLQNYGKTKLFSTQNFVPIFNKHFILTYKIIKIRINL